MQAGGQSNQNATTILQDAIAVITHERDSSRVLAVLLEYIRAAASATGASWVYADQYDRVGDVSYWSDNVVMWAGWLGGSPDVLTSNHPLPAALSVTAATWLTMRLDYGAGVVIWFADETPNVDEALLIALIQLFGVRHQQYLAELQQQRADLLSDSIINSILDPLIILDDQRRVIVMNKAAETLFAKSSPSQRGYVLDEVVADEQLMKIVNTPRSKVHNVRPLEWMAERTGQTFLPTLAVVHTPDGVPNGWVLSLRDVSRFKRLNQNQREFMRLVSHDLRSPLTAMQGFADMIRMGLVGEVTEKQVYFVEKILSGVSQMSSIVDNIQDAGRFDPETGFYEMSRTHVDLGALVTDIVKNQIIPPEKDQLAVNVSIADDVPIVNVDENMIKRAVVNLVDNAIKYTPNEGNVDVAVSKRDNSAVISISDDGYGISEENQKLLFQRHMRIARREHNKVKGTGLGLFIVKSVAQAHLGEAEVHSIEGEGTTFSLVLPLEGSNLISLAEETE